MSTPRLCRPARGRAAKGILLTALTGLALALAATPFRAADEAKKAAPRLEIKPGDHVCLIGNALAERMQHDGWLEAYFHSRFPEHDLVFRNLGFSGDEVAGFTDRPDFNSRLRSQAFGTADQWLAGSAPVPEPNRLVTRRGVRENRFETTNTRADVVLAFFGYNESFAGPAGLDAFKKDVDAFIRHTLAQKYNGKSAPRLVLFSPIAHEDLKDRNLPDGSENNARLELYTKAMAEVAERHGVVFVDLFRPTRELYTKADKPLTINGVHLNERGNEAVARLIDRALFAGLPEPKRDPAEMERLRRAVAEKNVYWFSRYRVVDGYNVYGGRAFEKYAEQQSNYEDQQRELEILDALTAAHERRVWQVARGGDAKVSTADLPPYIPVKTNKPGTGPGGAHVYLDGEEAIQKMTVAKGLKVTLFASEKEFPELAKPVQMQFDSKGRLWVAVWPSYPHWKPGEEMDDKILVFEDTKGTGKADKVTVFADHLHCPTGFEFYGGGVLVAQAPDLLFLKDTDGDGKADVRRRVLHGLDSADTHHTANSFALDPGGALYFQEGTFHHTQAETAYGPPLRCVNAGVFRYEPRAQKFDAYVTYGFANPHGHVFDRWGQDIVYDGTGANPYHAALFSGHLDYPNKHATPPQVYQQRTRPCPGVEILSSRHFPEENQGNLLVANVIGFQGILQYKVADKGASFAGTEVEPLLSSSDPNFRPSDLKVGPDGAVWFIDWHNPIIGHLQHAIRDPSRDRTHGRIYRVTCEGRPLSHSPPIAGEPVERLLELLKEPEDRVRYRARTELAARDTDQVMPALAKWVAGLDAKDPDHEHHVLEALWLHQSHNVVDLDLLKRVLASPEFRARAAATRVLCYWRDRVPEALDLLRKLAADPHPRVRLEAVRAASFLRVPEAVEVVLVAGEQPADPYVEFTSRETMKALDPFVKEAIAAGHRFAFTTPAGARFFLKSVGTDDLLKMERTPEVCRELLFRKGLRDEQRKEALAGLAKAEHQAELRVLLDALRTLDESAAQASGRRKPADADETVFFDLVRVLTDRPAAELAGARGDLEKLATGAKQPLTRQLGFVALIAADGGPDRAWERGTKSVASLEDLVHAMPLVRDPNQRAALYPKAAALLDGLPNGLAAAAPGGKPVMGRYVRVELPGPRRTLTLAEVEVTSGGRNVARQGKASQKNTDHGGDATRALDGNRSGAFDDGGQTHTQTTEDPWWEVDLGAEVPVESVVIYNRTDGNLGSRLNGFTLRVLDAGRKAVWERRNVPAPAEKAEFAVGGPDPGRAVRRAAMAALPSVRGQEVETFKALARFVRDDADRPAAVQALLRIPADHWPKEEAAPLLNDVLAAVRRIPVQERTTLAALDALQLADNLASLLPLAEARRVRKELGELGVRVVRLGTVPDQMLFDKDRLVVRAGRPVEVLFENTDLMPHNFVLTQPGALEEVGTLAEATATEPGAVARQYVPRSPKILVAGRLLPPRESQKLAFTAPSRPGVYPYVCTYPGHWRRMYGALYVVEDLDEYLADPEGYLAKHPLPAADELLKSNRPRKEWKFDELAPAVARLEGRSYSNGKRMFQVASCISCHKMEGVGTEIGADLTKLDPKDTPADILRDILEPSFRINEKYQSYVFETDDGKTVTGLVLEETADTVKVIENPLAKAAPVVLKKSAIANRQKSPTSIMPVGLLDKLTREEILDLVAYVASRGDARSKFFQAGHDHGHAHGPGH
jgi:putative heme-binding domain-containing protein